MKTYNLISEHKHNSSFNKSNELGSFDIKEARKEAKLLLMNYYLDDSVTGYRSLKNYINDGMGDYFYYIERVAENGNTMRYELY